jgi:N-ethylmaleimide reductase
VGRFGVSIQLGGRQPLSSSATNIGLKNRFTPKGYVPTETAKEMTLEDIAVTIDEHVHAAKCAIEAGFDAVEIVRQSSFHSSQSHANSSQTAGNGYLCDQFLNSKTNLRTDDYGGSKENRARFTLELLDAVVAAIGASKVALRFSPFGTVLMPLDADPISTLSYVLAEVEKRGIAYVCLTQPRTDLFLSQETKWANLHKASANGDMAVKIEEINLKSFEEILKTTPKLATGGYDWENCFEEVETGEMDAITFGRWFISNPDLVEKIRRGLKLTARKTEGVYSDGPEGYTDYLVGEVVESVVSEKV